MTRKEKFFEIFPNPNCDEGIPMICPCDLEAEFESAYCQDDMCGRCAYLFWNGEMKGENFFD